MNESTSGQKGESCCAARDSATTCCQPAAANPSSCCSPGEVSWKKGKALVAVIIIVAAIGVGANSFVRGTSAQSSNAGPAKSFADRIMEMPVAAAENSYQGKQQTKPEEMSVNRVVDSVQALDTLSADKDVVFLVLPGETLIHPVGIPIQLRTVANNLWQSGKRVGVFTLKNSAPDHAQLARHFSVRAFPCVIVLGRQGSASAVSGDISEAGLYNAFVLASTPASCCPGQSNASCCPK